MALRLTRPKRLWAAAGLLAVLALIGVLAATAGVSQRGALLKQLQTPAASAAPANTVSATATAGPGPVHVAITGLPYMARLADTPNRASTRDRLTLSLSDHGRPLAGAAVTVTYSMPSMNMTDGFAGRLTETAPGTYTAVQPVFGMPGTWQLRFRVAPRGGTAANVVVNDRMVG